MAESMWESDKMLNIYVHDYLMKKKFHASAKAFMIEAKVATDSVAIDAPEGFLFEWWSVFWDLYITRMTEKRSEHAAAYIETQKIKRKEEQQQLQRQQIQLMHQHNAQSQCRDPIPSHGGSINAMNAEVVMGQPSASVQAMKMYEELMKHPQPMDSETTSVLAAANRINTLNVAANQMSQLVQGNSGNIAAMQQIPQVSLTSDTTSEVNIGAPNTNLHADPSSNYGQAILQSKYELRVPGLNQGVTGIPLEGWPLTGIDQLWPSISEPVQKPNLQTQSQSLTATQQQNTRKRKQHLSSGPANSTGTGNTVGCSPGTPQSTQTTGDGMNTGMPQSLMMCCTEGTGGLALSSNLLDDIDPFGDLGSLADSLESLLSEDREEGRDSYGTIKQSLPEPPEVSCARSSFSEVGCIRTRNSKVTSCHFSSDGKLLACGGQDKKVVLWNMDTLQTESTPEEHKSTITDVCFRPNSTQLATASIDQSVRLWDAANPSYCLQAYTSHNSPVMSLDFHPKKTELFCFCDNENEIHYWNINSFSGISVFKGGKTQVRFQPRTGYQLAASSDNVVSIFDVEANKQTHIFQGHSDMVKYISWEAAGDYLASVSESSVKVWSLISGDCIHELISSNGTSFYSCVFYPCNPSLLVIGTNSSLELWNIARNTCMTVTAHEDIISSLAQSPVSGMVASSSHDSSVKLWK